MELSDGLWMLLIFVIAYTMNVVPVLGPPLWTVVAFFVLRFGIWVVPTTVAATFSAAWGRLTLTYLTRRYGGRVIRAQQDDVDAVGAFIDARRYALFPAAFLYSIALPTSFLFMAAGVIRVPLRPIFLGYWFSRACVDTILVLGVRAASEELIRGETIGVQALIAQAIGIGSFMLFLRLPWVRWLHRLIRFSERPAR